MSFAVPQLRFFCHNDNAYLCALCDVTVHQAHPLAASHVRVPIGKQEKEDSQDPFFEVPTVPDALCGTQELAELKQDEGKLGSLDLSFDDDAFFAVPDTAAKGAGRTSLDGPNGNLAKGFISDDLFGFDAGLDDFGFPFENGSSDMLADCLVPDADEADAAALNTNIVAELPFDLDPVAVAPTAASKGSAEEAVPFPGDSAHPSTPSSAPTPTTPGAIEPIFDNFLPISLIPMDSERFSALQERRMKVHRFWEKKKTRQFKKTIRYASRKRYAEVRPRIKGRFARKDEILAAQAAGVPLM